LPARRSGGEEEGDVYNRGMTNGDESKTVELDGRTYRVRRREVGETAVVYEALRAGEPVAGVEGERAIEAGYPAVMQMHGAVRRDGRIETQERAPEALDYSPPFVLGRACPPRRLPDAGHAAFSTASWEVSGSADA
jgi:hypothetical protein